MFKCKTNIVDFDTTNGKPNLEAAKVKTLAKAGVKKLLGQMETATPFFYVKDYFKDDTGKGIGDYLGFGNSKPLSKHFAQIEMKPGKMEKSSSAGSKEASMGKAYVNPSKLYLITEQNRAQQKI
jgi:hypothetical protein